MNVEMENKAAQFHFWEYMFQIFGTVYHTVQIESGAVIFIIVHACYSERSIKRFIP